MTVRWAFIGAGRHPQLWLAPAVANAPNSEIVGVWSRQPERASAFAAQYDNRPKVYSSIDEVVGDPQIDAVVVATPNNLHATHSLAALRAGKHVLCEKPMATSVEDAAEMVRAARSSGVQLGVGFHLRHNEVLAEARRRVEEGALGDVLYATAQFNLASSPRPRLEIPHSAWKRDAVQMGGAAALFAMGVHVLDLLRFLVGQDVVAVSASAVGYTPEQPLESSAQVALEFAAGARGHVMYGGSFPLSRNDAVLYGRRARLVAEGVVEVVTTGSLQLAVPDGRSGWRSESWHPVMTDHYQRQIEAFNRAVEEGSPFGADGIDGLRSAEIATAIIESQRTGRRVAIQRVDP